MQLDNYRSDIISAIQDNLNPKELKFIVFHEEKGFTVTFKVEDAMRMNKDIFAISCYNVIFLGHVKPEDKEDVIKQMNMVKALEKQESIHEGQKPVHTNYQEENPFHEIPYEDNINEEEVLKAFGDLKPLLEQPILVADFFTVVAYELGYYPEEIDRMLSFLDRMLPIYADHFRNRGELLQSIHEMRFVAQKILSQLQKAEDEVDLFVSVLAEKLVMDEELIHQEANSVLSSLLMDFLRIK